MAAYELRRASEKKKREAIRFMGENGLRRKSVWLILHFVGLPLAACLSVHGAAQAPALHKKWDQ
jgi:hypothetical protein